MKILDGKKLADQILRGLKDKIKKLDKKLNLVAVCVGSSSASKSYLLQKERASEKIGVNFKLVNLSRNISTSELWQDIKKLSDDFEVNGLLLQLPLPKYIEAQKVLNAISPLKDVDCLTEENLGKFFSGNPLILPPTIGAIAKILKKYKIRLQGKYVVIVGAGRLVGKTAALWAMNQGATVSVLNKLTPGISNFTKLADIVISGVGKPGLIKGNMIKKGAVVIDAGTSKYNNKIRGDVDFKSASKKASYITPVPGGVGPMTVVSLMENLVKLNS